MSEIVSGRLPTRPKCPACGQPLDGWTGGAGPGPRAGDLSVCVYCGEALLYTEALLLRVLTQGDRDELDDETLADLTRLKAIVARRIAGRN